MQMIFASHLIFLFFLANCQAGESLPQELESIHLQNVYQLTFSSMGFEKAGEAYFSPDGSKIAFQAVPKGQKEYQIYVMDLDESIPRMVSTGKGACTCAYFRPDGQRLIFASSHDALEVPIPKIDDGNYKWELTPYMNIYEADLDGSNLKALTCGSPYHAECAYSSDGSRIVYASNEDGSMNIYTMNADGTNRKQVTHTTHCYNGGPFFSPDGQHIVFRADRDQKDYLQIYVVDLNGDHEEQLTFNGAVNWAPYWHPNGKLIAFTTSLHGHRQYEVYLLNVATKAHHRLTYNASFDGLPVFSPDGCRMMWTSRRGLDKSCQIFIADFVIPEGERL